MRARVASVMVPACNGRPGNAARGRFSHRYRAGPRRARGRAHSRAACRRCAVRHDLARFEFTRHVRIVPAGPTHSHPILTLGTRFAETEDLLLSTYLHEQMHWYLWRLGGPDYDPVAPFFDELVRRYPKAPTKLPEGARNYEQTYVHLVVCWLEVAAMTELIGRERAHRRCRHAMGLSLDLSHRHRRCRAARGDSTRRTASRRSARRKSSHSTRRPARTPLPPLGKKRHEQRARPRSRRSRRTPPARGGRSRG